MVVLLIVFDIFSLVRQLVKKRDMIENTYSTVSEV